jgi:hypothetical protein
MDDFMEDVFDTVFNKSIPIERKMLDIKTTMMSYQNSMWENIRAYLSKR